MEKHINVISAISNKEVDQRFVGNTAQERDLLIALIESQLADVGGGEDGPAW